MTDSCVKHVNIFQWTFPYLTKVAKESITFHTFKKKFFFNWYNLLFLFDFNIISTRLIAWCITRYHVMIKDILNSYYIKEIFVYFSFYIYIILRKSFLLLKLPFIPAYLMLCSLISKVKYLYHTKEEVETVVTLQSDVAYTRIFETVHINCVLPSYQSLSTPPAHHMYNNNTIVTLQSIHLQSI